MNFDSTVFYILENNKSKKKPDKKLKSKSKLDFSKNDVNNDGKVDKTDEYLKKRNEAIKKNMFKSKNGK